MYKIVKAQPTDMPSLMKCLRRTDAGMLEDGLDIWDHGYPAEEDFLEDLEDETLFVVKEGARVIASIGTSFDLTGSFFGESRSQKKTVALLERIGHQGEPVVAFHRLFVDPAYQRKGIAKMLLKAIESRYPETTFVLAVYCDNRKAKAFYEVMGYQDFGRDFEFEFGPASDEYLMAKPYKKAGLCRELNW